MSEVAKFRQNLELEIQAMQQGLHGVAAVARHAFVTAKMEKEADAFERLKVKVGEQRAMEMLIEIESGSSCKDVGADE